MSGTAEPLSPFLPQFKKRKTQMTKSHLKLVVNNERAAIANIPASNVVELPIWQLEDFAALALALSDSFFAFDENGAAVIVTPPVIIPGDAIPLPFIPHDGNAA